MTFLGGVFWLQWLDPGFFRSVWRNSEVEKDGCKAKENSKMHLHEPSCTMVKLTNHVVLYAYTLFDHATPSQYSPGNTYLAELQLWRRRRRDDRDYLVLQLVITITESTLLWRHYACNDKSLALRINQAAQISITKLHAPTCAVGGVAC